MPSLTTYSIGVGDRFGFEAKAQLAACDAAAKKGIEITPVWNKSNRECLLTGMAIERTRAAADEAVASARWTRPYFVDADHITLTTVDRFAGHCDFFTIDVAEQIGAAAPARQIDAFVEAHPELRSTDGFRGIAERYLAAVKSAGEVYRRIAALKQPETFLVEVSMDETSQPQSPAELTTILAALADEGVPVDTIAPKFTGSFFKGVDYEGDLARFEQEFTADIKAVREAVSRYHLPAALKLSVHSGSDKFALYPIMGRVLAQTGSGVHLKTAGTTWLEEAAGIAESGPEGLAFAKNLYAAAFEQRKNLSAPYATVLRIAPENLPGPGEVARWSSERFAAAVTHDCANPLYNPDLRQLLHVAYPLAAAAGQTFYDFLANARDNIEKRVTSNLLDRHILPLFDGK